MGTKMPALTKPEILRKVDEGEIVFISVDTTVFSKSENNLERGLLTHLAQFEYSEVDFILSEIVVRELTSHIEEDIDKSDRAFKRSINSLRKNRNIDESLIQSTVDTLVDLEPSTSIANERVKKFLQTTGANVIKAKDFVPLDNLVNDYFDTKPPFENVEKKKYEFPDAIALYSLEEYAKKLEKMMIVVSKDKGWVRYCQSSDWLVCEKNLGVAMSHFNRLPSVAESAMEKNEDSLVTHINRALVRHVSHMYVNLLIASDYIVDSDVYDTTFHNYYISHTPAFNLISYDENDRRYVFQLNVDVEVGVSADIVFFKIEGDRQIKIGESSLDQEVDTTGSVTITVSGNLNGNFCVESVEVDDVDGDIHLTNVVPEKFE